MKEIKDDTNRWRNIPCSWTGRINIMKMSILPETIYRVNAIPIKLTVVFFRELEQIIHNLYGNTKKPWIDKAIWERRMELEESTCLTSDYTTKLVIKTVWYRHRNIHRWNKIQSPEINPHIYGHLIFDKGGKNIQFNKDSQKVVLRKPDSHI